MDNSEYWKRYQDLSTEVITELRARIGERKITIPEETTFEDEAGNRIMSLDSENVYFDSAWMRPQGSYTLWELGLPDAMSLLEYV